MKEHISVLRREVIQILAPKENENFIDATVGLGGHAAEILAKTGPEGKLLGIDQDPSAINRAEMNLENYSPRLTLVEANFDELGLIVRGWQVEKIDGILFDLGVSSLQLASDRGFSFQKDGPLDMRMAENNSLTAEKIVNTYPEEKIRQLLFRYGEESWASAIASKIVRVRERRPIKSTSELVEIIATAIPEKEKVRRHHHFATQSFQALRIAVNDELGSLESGLKQAVQILSPGGRIVVISFHSLEDRIVKNFFRENPNIQILNKKPVVAQEEEIKENPRARSAKLRAAVKL